MATAGLLGLARRPAKGPFGSARPTCGWSACRWPGSAAAGLARPDEKGGGRLGLGTRTPHPRNRRHRLLGRAASLPAFRRRRAPPCATAMPCAACVVPPPPLLLPLLQSAPAPCAGRSRRPAAGHGRRFSGRRRAPAPLGSMCRGGCRIGGRWPPCGQEDERAREPWTQRRRLAWPVMLAASMSLMRLWRGCRLCRRTERPDEPPESRR